MTSLFTYWKGPHWTAKDWSEIDIEIVPSITHENSKEGPFHVNLIYENHGMSGAPIPNDTADVGTDWHTYSFEWTPEYISWTFDGKEVYKQEASASGKEGDAVRWLQQREQTLIMNFWTPTFWSWHDGFEADGMPWYAEYDWVEVHDYDEKSKTFTQRWKDEFNSIDYSRWEVASSGSFQQNTCEWSRDNVYTQDGHLVLKMDKSGGGGGDHHSWHHWW